MPRLLLLSSILSALAALSAGCAPTLDLASPDVSSVAGDEGRSDTPAIDAGETDEVDATPDLAPDRPDGFELRDASADVLPLDVAAPIDRPDVMDAVHSDLPYVVDVPDLDRPDVVATPDVAPDRPDAVDAPSPTDRPDVVDPRDDGPPACELTCAVRAHATATCASGVCVFTCDPGYGDCDAAPANGCETDLRTNVSHCGRCGGACEFPGGTVACVSGICAPGSCAAPRADCNRLTGDGCEVDTSTSLDHCGGCGRPCRADHGTTGCATGLCSLLRCDAGYADCDGRFDNGCETSLDLDTSCGACGRACAAGVRCVARLCTGPRPVAPPSTSTATTRRPRFRWVSPVGADGARVEWCRDPTCATVIERATATAAVANATPTADLPPGPVFWRVRATVGGVDAGPISPTWEVFIGARSAPVAGAWGTTLDLNRDGYADSAVGAPQADPDGVTDFGNVEVRYGGPSGLGGLTRVIGGTGAGGLGFGETVASAGDVNGDGYGDLIVGNSNTDVPSNNSGSVAIYFGGPTGVARTPSQVITGTRGQSSFGTSVDAAGDVNGDGYGDVIVGWPFYNPGDNHSGAAAVFHGGPNGLDTRVATLIRGETISYFGYTVAGAGDVDGDGYEDVAVGSYNDGRPLSGLASVGSVTVCRGSAAGLITLRPQVLLGSESSAEFSRGLAGGGDLNGDGYADLAVGSPRLGTGVRYDWGSVSVFSGSGTGLVVRPQVIEGVGSLETLGGAVSITGDVNGDGYADLLAGGSYATAGGRSRAGIARLFLGGADGVSAVAVRTYEGEAATDYFGTAVSIIGDLDRDGYADLAVATPWSSPEGRSRAGHMSVFRGSASGAGTLPSQVLLGAAGDYLGTALAWFSVRRLPTGS